MQLLGEAEPPGILRVAAVDHVAERMHVCCGASSSHARKTSR